LTAFCGNAGAPLTFVGKFWKYHENVIILTHIGEEGIALMKVFRYILLIISILFFGQGSLSAQMFLSQRDRDIEGNLNYNEGIYVLSNYSDDSVVPSEPLSLEELLERDVEAFYFYLRKDTVSNAMLLRNPDGSFTPFSEALVTIKKALTDHPKKILTLFLDYLVETDMARSFSEVGLLDYVCEYDNRSGWPTMKNMIESDRRLVIFEIQHHLNSPSWVHNTAEHVEHAESEWSMETPVVEDFDERMKKSLSLYNGLKYLENNRAEEEIYDMARYSPYIIEAFKRAWVRDGMMPNFVLVNRYYSWLNVTVSSFRNFSIVTGFVTYNGELLNYVNWEGLSNSTTGKFSLPLELGADMELYPTSPGFVISPERMRIEDNGSRRIFVSEFKAKAMPISQNLELNLPLNGSVKDESKNKYATTSNGVEFGLDPIRGEVASFENRMRVNLPTSSELFIRDHDFTVGVWLKIPKYLTDKTDYCILGSKNNAYQQGLHFLIRNHKPYMGFFNNDLSGNTEIEPGKWYHVVWRYNKHNSEQAIFVNGKLDAIAVDRPAYLGNDSLYVGYVDFSQSASFEGNLSSFNVWSRVLSDKEIIALNSQVADLNASQMGAINRWLLVGLVVALLLLAYFFYRFYKHRKAESAVSTNLNQLAKEEKPEQLTNVVRLFGEFLVIDRDGEDITALFTPKIKQIFLLILLSSSRGGQGISGNDLAACIWGDSEGKKIKSLRSVSILKLRKILDRLDKMEVLFNASHYTMQVQPPLSCDYLQYLDMLREKRVKTKRDFEQFYRILSRGEVFEGESFDWMDDYKSYVCNSSVDVMSRFIGDYSVKDESDTVIQIAEQILVNDPSNEEALSYKVRALIAHNNFKQARYAYDKFCNEYKAMYDEPFGLSFDQISSETGLKDLI